MKGTKEGRKRRKYRVKETVSTRKEGRKARGIVIGIISGR